MQKRTVTRSELKTRSNGIVWLPVTFSLGILVWYLLVWAGDLRPFILPTPDLVFSRFIRALADGTVWRHGLVTLGEVVPGLMIGALFASSLGYLLAKSKRLERLLSPYIVASQSVPTVAIAPLLVIWFGPGITSKILICALIVFFPILINTIVGIRSIPRDLIDLMRSLKASKWQTFKFMELPATLPIFLGGLRIGATLSVIGAVVGEFVGADRGLGFLINDARFRFDTAMVFVGVFALVTMALVLHGIVVLLEKRALVWQRESNEQNI
ncbi:MAG: ABC transporter permease [Chloroflexota bacterium]